MELRTPAASSDDDIYQFADAAQPTAPAPTPAPDENKVRGDVTSMSRTTPSKMVPGTMISDPVIVAVKGSSGVVADGQASEQSATDAADPKLKSTVSADKQPTPAVGMASQGNASADASTPGSQGDNLRTRRRKQARRRYLMEAWGASLVVHVVLLSALAAGTFTSRDAIKKIVSFDSALTSSRNGEPEDLPIYADPDNIARDRAIGDEYAVTPGETAQRSVGDGGRDSEGEESGGMIVASGVGSGRPSNTPRVRGVGKGRINEGQACPA